MKQVETYYQRPITYGVACSPRPSLLHTLSALHRDTQRRTRSALEVGAAAASYVVYASACAAMARKEQVSK